MNSVTRIVQRIRYKSGTVPCSCLPVPASGQHPRTLGEGPSLGVSHEGSDKWVFQGTMTPLETPSCDYVVQYTLTQPGRGYHVRAEFGHSGNHPWIEVGKTIVPVCFIPKSWKGHWVEREVLP